MIDLAIMEQTALASCLLARVPVSKKYLPPVSKGHATERRDSQPAAFVHEVREALRGASYALAKDLLQVTGKTVPSTILLRLHPTEIRAGNLASDLADVGSDCPRLVQDETDFVP